MGRVSSGRDDVPPQPSSAELVHACSSAPHAALLRDRLVTLLLVRRACGEMTVAHEARELAIGQSTLYRHLRDLRGYGAIWYQTRGRAGIVATVRPIERWTTRGQLVLENQDMVVRIAKWLHRKLPRWVSLDEHIANGQVGLLQAAERYDPFSPIPFTAFAHRRVQGAIIDAYSGKRYRAELDSELPETYDKPTPDPWEDHQRTETRELIELALEDLPEVYADACRTYLQDESLRDYGARVGISESGACVRRQQALGMLRQALEQRGITADSIL